MTKEEQAGIQRPRAHTFLSVIPRLDRGIQNPKGPAFLKRPGNELGNMTLQYNIEGRLVPLHLQVSLQDFAYFAENHAGYRAFHVLLATIAMSSNLLEACDFVIGFGLRGKLFKVKN